MLQIAEAGAAIVFLDRDTEHAELAELGPELAWELVAAVDLRRDRRDQIVAKGAHAAAQLIGGLAQIEVEAWEIIGKHAGGSSCGSRRLLLPMASAEAIPPQAATDLKRAAGALAALFLPLRPAAAGPATPRSAAAPLSLTRSAQFPPLSPPWPSAPDRRRSAAPGSPATPRAR